MSSGARETQVERFNGAEFHSYPDVLAVEEPLEIRLAFGERDRRAIKSISVTMRTPGNDAELAVGFLVTEGVVRDGADIVSIAIAADDTEHPALRDGDAIVFTGRASRNVVTVELAAGVEVSPTTLERNFYTTSSCGVCGKTSLLALRTVCPPRRKNDFVLDVDMLCGLPAKLRAAQGIFDRTGGLHAAGLFGANGTLEALREDVGRHNAVDKLIGAAVLEDRLPLRHRVLLLSGRASFELLQKAVMAGIPMVASVGAPSSLAVEVAREFDVTLVGFLRDDRFNVYHEASRVRVPVKAGL